MLVSLGWARSRRSTPDRPEAAFKGRMSGFCPNQLLPGYYPRRANDRFRVVVGHRACRIAVGRFKPEEDVSKCSMPLFGQRSIMSQE